MFPEQQLGPHREWRAEVEYLDAIFKTGAAYTVGKVNGDHWLLYMIPPHRDSISEKTEDDSQHSTGIDYTIEILMTHLNPTASQHFFTSTSLDADTDIDNDQKLDHAQKLSHTLGISSLFPPHLTTLDAYTFSPCGYSSNALLKWGKCAQTGGDDTSQSGEGYYTIHVTPEEGWSYASFECNVPLSTAPTPQQSSIPDLKTLVRRVVSIFQPGKLSLTLFISSDHNNSVEEEGESPVEAAQRAFREALTSRVRASPDVTPSPVYRRTDKINYGFGAYDLAFATFELTP